MTVPEPEFAVRTRAALADPRPGDRYHEMYTWWTVVVAVSDWGVTVLQAGGPFNLVLGRVRSNSPARERGDPDWIKVDPWQVRAEQRHFHSLAEFQAHMKGDLLADRGLDISRWLAERAR